MSSKVWVYTLEAQYLTLSAAPVERSGTSHLPTGKYVGRYSRAWRLVNSFLAP